MKFMITMFICLLSFIIYISCDTTDADNDTSRYEFEKYLTSQQLQDEIAMFIRNGWSDETFCFNQCKVLTVPSKDEEKTWSAVSWCKIDLCHGTGLCTKGIDGLIDRLKNCNEQYQHTFDNQPEPVDTIESSSDEVIESSETVESSSSETLEESSSSEDFGDIAPTLTTDDGDNQ